LNTLDQIKSTARGVAVLNDWLGGGGQPVSPEQAESRARACIPCPHNKSPNWWGRTKNRIAQAIRDNLEAKHKLQLETKWDDALAMCDICGCCNQLSVWTPIDHIKSHTSTETLNSYPDHCWKKQEILVPDGNTN
jgi:hypothetical protein